MTGQREIRVVVHHEDESWWAESPDIAGFTAAAGTARELKELIEDGVPFALDEEPGSVCVTLETAEGGPVIFSDPTANRPWTVITERSAHGYDLGIPA